MPSIRVKSRTGHITDLTVDELLEIDGKPYQPANSDALAERMAYLEGRVNSLYELFTQSVEGGEVSLNGAGDSTFAVTHSGA